MKNIKYFLIGAIIIITLFSTSGSPTLLKSNEKLLNIFLYNSQGSPYGPTEGIVDIKYTFCIDLPDNVECEPYYVLWDFGDGQQAIGLAHIKQEKPLVKLILGVYLVLMR